MFMIGVSTYYSYVELSTAEIRRRPDQEAKPQKNINHIIFILILLSTTPLASPSTDEDTTATHFISS